MIDPTLKVRTLAEEFRSFALKGNVVDLAVGVVIGAAFGKIVDSLVKHIIMPSISMIAPGQRSYVGWKVVAGGSEIPFGLFLSEVVNFLIVAMALFVVVRKFLGWALRTRTQSPPAPSPPTKQEELLTEIRDLLKTRTA
jgi:large conductance mechanosensitive channel